MYPCILSTSALSLPVAGSPPLPAPGLRTCRGVPAAPALPSGLRDTEPGCSPPSPAPSLRSPRGTAGRRRGDAAPPQAPLSPRPPGAYPSPPGGTGPRTPPTFAGAAAATLRQEPSYTGAGGIAAPARFHAAFGLLMAKSHQPAWEKQQITIYIKKKKALKLEKCFKMTVTSGRGARQPLSPPCPARTSGGGAWGLGAGPAAPQRLLQRGGGGRSALHGRGAGGPCGQTGLPPLSGRKRSFQGEKMLSLRSGGGCAGGVRCREREIRTAREEVC